MMMVLEFQKTNMRMFLSLFYKIDKSRNETKSSVGLGMSIASDIIQSHGGNIKLEKSILKGLKVKITLPF